MKLKIFSWALFGLMMVLSLAAFFYVRQEYHTNNVPKNDFYACDFHMRMNEIDCVKRGINPYDVWSMKCEVMPYVPNNHHELWTPERCEFINAYSPWEYIMLMPISCLPRKLAWTIYNCGQLFALVGIALIAFLFGKKHANNGPFVAAFSLFILFFAKPDLRGGNFCLYITFAMFCMAFALNKGHDFLAGFAWTVVMLKPQIGLLFAIPLLFWRKWKTFFVASTLCVAMTVISAFMCDTSVFDLLKQATQGSVHGFHGCGLLPYNVFCNLNCRFPANVLITIASLLGFVICGILTAFLKHHKNWFCLLMPASICAVTCNYNNGYNFCICALLLVIVGVCFLHARNGYNVAFLLVLLGFAIRADLFAYLICMSSGVLSRHGILSSPDICPEDIWTLGSWSATLLLALTVCFVLQIRARREDGFISLGFERQRDK